MSRLNLWPRVILTWNTLNPPSPETSTPTAVLFCIKTFRTCIFRATSKLGRLFDGRTHHRPCKNWQLKDWTLKKDDHMKLPFCALIFYRENKKDGRTHNWQGNFDLTDFKTITQKEDDNIFQIEWRFTVILYFILITLLLYVTDLSYWKSQKMEEKVSMYIFQIKCYKIKQTVCKNFHKQ